MNRLRRIAIRFTPDDLQGRLALIITLAIAPICALALVLAIFQVRNAEEARLAAFEAQALDAIDEERAAMIKIKQGLRLAAAQAADELATTGGCDATIAAISKDHEWSTVSRIFNRDGVLSCGGNKVVDISERPEWKAFSADPIFTISDPFTGRFSGKDVILAYLPLPGAGRKHFAVVVGIDLAYITLLLGEDVAGMPVALLNRRGEVVTENRVAAAMSAAVRSAAA